MLVPDLVAQLAQLAERGGRAAPGRPRRALCSILTASSPRRCLDCRRHAAMRSSRVRPARSGCIIRSASASIRGRPDVPGVSWNLTASGSAQSRGPRPRRVRCCRQAAARTWTPGDGSSTEADERPAHPGVIHSGRSPPRKTSQPKSAIAVSSAARSARAVRAREQLRVAQIHSRLQQQPVTEREPDQLRGRRRSGQLGQVRHSAPGSPGGRRPAAASSRWPAPAGPDTAHD